MVSKEHDFFTIGESEDSIADIRFIPEFVKGHVQYYAGTCNLQPITAYRPVDGISPLEWYQPLAG